jgi:hypothetical protein
MTRCQDQYAFVCPGCAEAIAVNGPMRRSLIDNGCVVCGGTVSDAAFTPDCGAEGP